MSLLKIIFHLTIIAIVTIFYFATCGYVVKLIPLTENTLQGNFIYGFLVFVALAPLQIILKLFELFYNKQLK